MKMLQKFACKNLAKFLRIKRISQTGKNYAEIRDILAEICEILYENAENPIF
jgi:hypothetical protein